MTLTPDELPLVNENPSEAPATSADQSTEPRRGIHSQNGSKRAVLWCLFALQAIVLTAIAAIVGTSPKLAGQWNAIVLLPGAVWMVQMLLLWKVSGRADFAASIGLVIGIYFVVPDSEWGPSPVFWHLWHAPLWYDAFQKFGLPLVAAGAFLAALLVSQAEARILLRCMGVLAMAIVWCWYVNGSVFEMGWKVVSSFPLGVFMLLLVAHTSKN